MASPVSPEKIWVDSENFYFWPKKVDKGPPLWTWSIFDIFILADFIQWYLTNQYSYKSGFGIKM